MARKAFVATGKAGAGLKGDLPVTSLDETSKLMIAQPPIIDVEIADLLTSVPGQPHDYEAPDQPAFGGITKLLSQSELARRAFTQTNDSPIQTADGPNPSHDLIPDPPATLKVPDGGDAVGTIDPVERLILRLPNRLSAPISSNYPRPSPPTAKKVTTKANKRAVVPGKENVEPEGVQGVVKKEKAKAKAKPKGRKKK
ncbi:uncharacterized protein MELLADRAFT_114225 [Melampsora larici-populina 98AG31]|uniref:Uncharacterized protein n=1 Tax=Melampsora larici-populina (strain 98AG31 / pathotype 3-4-7) TaxID=747676 RepID=F4SCP2_MELLP|nr:uncharacterized protein MELLADRAFT_114225 [Melampsora larici-populina 98AG31]EGF97578.1 hypothetical protein MELLADRAFT_114225 [Melampsora larici-populina 98AG31]